MPDAKDARIAELVAALDGLVSAVSGWERVILNGLPHIVTVEPGSGFDAAFNAAVQALAGDGSAGAKVIQAARKAPVAINILQGHIAHLEDLAGEELESDDRATQTHAALVGREIADALSALDAKED